MDLDQTARMCMLVWIHAGRKSIMLALSWRGSFENSSVQRDAALRYLYEIKASDFFKLWHKY
jgi:hypothetical protein